MNQIKLKIYKIVLKEVCVNFLGMKDYKFKFQEIYSRE